MRHKPFPGFSVALAGIALLVMATGPAIFTSAATEASESGPERAPQVAMAIRAFNFSLARDDIDAAHGAPILAALESGRIPPKGAQVMADFLHMPAAMRSQRLEGALAFMFEDFEGNGRTCETCHGLDIGTFTLEQVRARYAEDPRDPLFRALDSDAGDGRSYARLLANGTVSVRIPLPMGVKLADDPTAHDAVLFRGTPTFFNSAALDPVLMHDGRAPDLQSQAHDALETHAEVARMPSLAELDAIAEFQRAFFTFSDNERPSYGTGNPKNELPEGRTDAERRGRLFFVDMPVDAKTGHGVCAACHSGPLWNETNEHVATFFPRIIGMPGAGRPIPTESGMRLLSNGSAERNMAGLPMRHWQLQSSDGAWVSLESPDVGAALAPKVTGVSDALQARLSPAMRANLFKITSLRAIAATPPYFHDNSALSLEDVVEHYAVFLDKGVGSVRPATPVTLSTQDKADIVAYLKLL